MIYDPNQVYEIPMKEIFADEDFNCRGVINPLDVVELANSIKEKGLQQPIMVQPWDSKPGKKFRIVMGYRRYKACQVNGMQTIRALVKEGLNDLDARILNLSENLHRKDLNIQQEAQAIDHFRRAGWTRDEVAKRIGKSSGWVQIRYMVLEMPEDIQAEVAAGVLTQQQIRDCYSLPSVEQQFEFVRKVKDKKLQGKTREVKPEKIGKRNEKRARSRQEIFAMQEHIREQLGHNIATRVLGWAAGEISDSDVHGSMREYAENEGKTYSEPALVE